MPRGAARLWRRSVALDPSRPDLEIVLVEDPTDEGTNEGTGWCSWCLWPAARVLVEHLSAFPDDELQGRSVLELGSGTGAVGAYMRRRGCSPVVLTDVYKSLPLLKRNLAANKLSPGPSTGVEVCALPWGTPLDRLADGIQRHVPFDFVVASDCTYEFVSPEKPSPSLEALLRSAQLGRRALICMGRRHNEVEAFEATLRRAALPINMVFRGTLANAKVEGVEEALVFELVFSQRGDSANNAPKAEAPVEGTDSSR